MRIALLVVVLAAAAAGVFFLQDGETPDTDLTVDDGGLDGTAHIEEGATLEGTGTGVRPTETRPPRREPARAPEPTADADEAWLTGRVLAKADGTPIGGARIWIEPAREPCPRPLFGGQGQVPQTTTVGGRDGAFTLRAPRGTKRVPVDVFVAAPGYVGAMQCGVRGSEVVFELARARQLRGITQDAVGRPVGGVVLRTRPPEGVPPTPANSVLGKSGENGEFVLDGLTDEVVHIEAAHPEYMPWSGGPFTPGEGTRATVDLTPAWRLRFVLRTDDGQEAKNPRVTWVTDGDAPRKGLQMLSFAPREADDRGPPIGLLAIPCDRGRVSIEIEADGYTPWRVAGEPIPPDGGEHTLEVLLRQDRTQGSVRIFLEDPDGARLSYLESGGRFSVAWLGDTEGPAGIPNRSADALEISSVPAGPYRFTIYARDWMPTVLEVEVPAGGSRDVVAKLRPPAQLRVRFVAPTAGLVRFRILRDGRPVHAFPIDAEHAEGKPETPGAPPPLIGSGAGEGLLLSGLGEGAHTIEVHPDPFEGTKQTVDLVAGEVTTVEVTLRAR